MTAPALEIRDLSLALRGVPVLEDVNLRLDPGDFLGIIGPNGAGKTVLLRVILGLLRPDRGTVRIFGRPPAEARGDVAYVPQHARFDPDYPIRVSEVVSMGTLGARGPNRRDVKERAKAALDQVGLDGLGDRQIGKLSGGQVQRVLIARALAVNARLLLLDEPTSSLDTRIVAEVYELIAKLSKDRTVILVSHDVAVLPRYVKSVGCMNRRLFHHASREITQEMIEATYGCPVDMLVHRHTHRVVEEHE